MKIPTSLMLRWSKGYKNCISGYLDRPRTVYCDPGPSMYASPGRTQPPTTGQSHHNSAVVVEHP